MALPETPRQRMPALRWTALVAACLAVTACSPREAHVGSSLGLLLIAHAWLCALVYVMPPKWGYPLRTGAGLLLLGLLAFSAFWATFLLPAASTAFAALLLLAPAAGAAYASRHRLRPCRDLVTVNALVLPSLALSLLVLWAGLHPFDWEGNDWTVPARRWRDMPIDNWLSFMVADMLARGALVSPMLEEWLTSDRPPLQAGLSLVFSKLIAGHAGLAYQVSSTWAQTLVLVPLSLMLTTLSSHRLRAVALIVLGMSALVFFNALFVWPKLMAATYCALYHLMLFHCDPRDRPVPAWASVAAGLAAALALLSHGGAAFALIGSTLAFLWMGRGGALLPVLRTAATSILLYVPWVLYQRLVDPPGDRLLKWHFGGKIAVTDQSLVAVLRESYASVTPREWLEGRWLNVETMLAGTVQFFSDAWSMVASPGDNQPWKAPQGMVEASFFSTAYSFWFFSILVVPPLLLYLVLRRMPPAATWPRGLPLATALALVAWIALMFIPGSTIVHAGAYMTTLSLQLLIMLLVARASPPLFLVLAVGNVLMCCALYVFNPPVAGMSSTAGQSAMAAVLVGLFVASCFYSQGVQSPRLPLPEDGP